MKTLTSVFNEKSKLDAVSEAKLQESLELIRADHKNDVAMINKDHADNKEERIEAVKRKLLEPKPGYDPGRRTLAEIKAEAERTVHNDYVGRREELIISARQKETDTIEQVLGLKPDRLPRAERDPKDIKYPDLR